MNDNNMKTNWKYEKWKDSPVSMYKDIETYIAMEIPPEDIELFSFVLLPNTILYRDRVIMIDIDGSGDVVTAIKKNFDDWASSHGSQTAQWMTNKTLVSNVFLNSIASETSSSTLIQIAKLIQHNWEYFLIKNYPDKKFVVEIGDMEWGDPYVTFYQQE